MYPQYNTLSLQHVFRSHNAFRIIHPIGIYIHNAVVPGRSIKHPIAMYTHNAFRSIHPMAIYTHNLIRIMHPIAIYTHKSIRFVFNVFTACLQCRVNCVSIHTHTHTKMENVIHVTYQYEERKTYRGCHTDFGCSRKTVLRTDFS